MNAIASEATTGPLAGWRRFWNRGGWWKAFLASTVYLAIYVGGSQIIGTVFAEQIGEDILATPTAVFFGLALPIIIGAVLLFAFALSVGWLRELFGPQPIKGSWWMWSAPIVVVGLALLRIFGTDWNSFNPGTVVMVFATGLLIGLAEELLTRGIAVDLLRKGGYSERVVMLLSSLIFALLHSANLFSGQAPSTVLITMGFTFVFGIAMYLTMRVTGSIIWAIVLHAITDPTTMLATGGVDAMNTAPNPLVTIAGQSIPLYILIAIIAVIFVKGRVQPKVPANELSAPAAA